MAHGRYCLLLTVLQLWILQVVRIQGFVPLVLFKPTTLLASSSSSSSRRNLPSDESYYNDLDESYYSYNQEVQDSTPSTTQENPLLRDTHLSPKEATATTTTATDGEILSEFYRPLVIDEILKTRGGRPRLYRDYELTIAADEMERANLAARFDWTTLHHLGASLSVRLDANDPETPGWTVQVKGSVDGEVSQLCRRTNEEFKTRKQFDFSLIVKPVFLEGDGDNGNSNNPKDPVGQLTGSLANPSLPDVYSRPYDEEQGTRDLKKYKRKPRSKQTVTFHQMVNVEKLIKELERENELDLADVIEDVNIYSGETGVLDVGELVAQSFYLELDPMIYKPDSKPLELVFEG